jgi:phage FluMu gp28-like protein
MIWPGLCAQRRRSDLIVQEMGQDLVRQWKLVIEMRNVPFETQRDILFFVGERLPRFGHAAFDATGNGAYLAEVAAQKWGARVSRSSCTRNGIARTARPISRPSATGRSDRGG